MFYEFHIPYPFERSKADKSLLSPWPRLKIFILKNIMYILCMVLLLKKKLNKLELSSVKLRRLMKLCWKTFYEMIFDGLEARTP